MDESLNNNSKHEGRGGARAGAGRPKGKMEAQTIERMKAKEVFMERVAHNVDKLFNAQLDKAIGEKYLMCIRTTGTGAKAKRETVIIDNLEIIKQYLNDELDDTETEYYFMSTKPADNNAIQGLLDRGFGKATEKIETDITSLGEQISQPLDARLAAQFVTFLKDNTRD